MTALIRVPILPPHPSDRVAPGSRWLVLATEGQSFRPIMGTATATAARKAVDRARTAGSRAELAIAKADGFTWEGREG